MKKYATTLFIISFFIFSNVQLSAQYELSDQFELIEGDCQIRNTYTFDNWELYQTENNKWDGAVDTIYECLHGATGRDRGIFLDQIKTDQPLFARYKKPSNDIVQFMPNSLFNLKLSIFSEDFSFPNSLECNDTSCVSMIMNMNIPDEDGQRTNETWRFYPKDVHFSGVIFETCDPTFKFDSQYVEDIVIQLIFPEDLEDEAFLKMRSIYIEHFDLFSVIQEDVVIDNYTITDNIVDLGLGDLTQFSWEPVTLVTHDRPDYPSNINIDDKVINLIPEPLDSVLIRITVHEYEQLEFQEHTGLIGALIEGQEPRRHGVEIVNDGADMCVFWVEIVTGGGNTFRYNSGNLSFASPFSCMRYKEEARFIISDQSNLKYGQSGIGMLALDRGSKTFLEKGSTLFFNGLLRIGQGDGLNRASVYLEDGASMEFGSSARLDDVNDEILDVYAYHDQVDLSRLDKEYHHRINIIEPLSDLPKPKELGVVNPSHDELVFLIPEEFKEIESAEIKIYDMSGNAITQTVFLNGRTRVRKDISMFESGMYFVEILAEDLLYRGKMLKL